jgi:hypothetical protein
MEDRAYVQEAQAELPAEVFLRRQHKRNRNTGLVRVHSIFADDGVQGDERNRENVILQHDVRYAVYSYGICVAPHGAGRAGENAEKIFYNRANAPPTLFD